MLPEPFVNFLTDLLKQHPFLCLIVLIFGYYDRLLNGLCAVTRKLVDLWFDLRLHCIKRRKELQKLMSNRVT